MRISHRVLLTFSAAALVALLYGCASSGPSTSQAPPEIPEDRPPATGAAEGEEGTQGDGGGQGGGGGGAGGEEGQSGSEGSSDAGQGEEGGGGGDGPPAGSLAGTQGGAQQGGQPPAGSPTTGDETAAALDRELGGALEEFDRRMREEMQRLAEETADAERAGSQGSSGDATGEPTPGGASDPGGNTEEGGDSAGSVGGSGPGGAGSERVPADVGDGSNDDIVARQLREAAMAEDDPELREKLWEEYRRYKASLGGSTKDGN